MADRYVNPAVGSSGAGTSWATAYKTLLEATNAAAANETIYFYNGSPDVVTTNPTYNIAAGVKIISTADNVNNPPQSYNPGASVSSTTFGVDIQIQCSTNNGTVSIFGVSFAASNSGTALLVISGGAQNCTLIYEDCTFNAPSNGGTITIGATGVRINIKTITRRCTWLFGVSTTYLVVGGKWISDGDIFASSGTVPSTLMAISYDNNSGIYISGADLSNISGTLVNVNGSLAGTSAPLLITITNSKLHASVTPASGFSGGAETELLITDCSYMNGYTLVGRLFYHENYYGSTTISTSIYANVSPNINSSVKLSWLVDGKSTATFHAPYVSPWIDWYTYNISNPITPRLEILRDGSTTPYTTNQVWSEWEVRTTSDSAKYTLDTSDRFNLLSSTSVPDQSSSGLTAADWINENASSWFGKLEPSAPITIAELGTIRGRICIGGDYTVYVCPQIFS